MDDLSPRYRRHLEIVSLTRARNLAADFYTDSALAQLENERIFAREWQVVCHLGRLQVPGSFVTAELGGRPVVATRDAQGQLHVMDNVCRHRGGPLAAGEGCAHQLVCRYHGWRYGLDGQLLEATDFGQPEAFDTARIRLNQLPTLEWGGFLLACADRQANPPAERLAAVRQRLSEHHPIESYRYDHRETYDIACNWKLYVDNYLEGYHVPLLHPGLNAQLSFGDYVTEVEDGYSVQWAPLQSAITRGGESVGDACYIHLYPNLMLNCLPGRLQVNTVRPLAVDRCRVVFDYYYADDISAETRRIDQESAHQTQLEDVGICETVQRNMTSGAYVSGRLSPKWEQAVWAFQNWVRQRLGDSA